MTSFSRLIYWLCIALISVTTCAILLSGWWIGQRYSEAVAEQQINRADYFLQGFLESEQALHTTAVKGVITDFGFRRTVADGDPDTIASMLDNHAQRVGLDLLLITDRDGQFLSSYGSLIDDDSDGRVYQLLKDTPDRPHLIALQNGFYWLYLSSIKAPHIVGYAIAGTAVDIDKLNHIQSLTGVDLSIYSNMMGYALNTSPQVARFIENGEHDTLVPSPWERQRFISRQININDLPRGDIKLYMTADLSDFHRQFDRFSINMLIVTFLLVTLITIASLLVSRRMVMPFENLQKKLLHRASFDHLTGIHNRLTVSELCQRSLAESQRAEKPFFIALLDLDHFKAVNDSHGHTAGDMVLSEVAQRLKSSLRNYDVLGRYGGEEFIIAGQLSANDCRHNLLRIKDVISGELFSYKDKRIDMTLSIGACFIDFADFSGEVTLQRLIEWADQALYKAKSEGRDRVVIHHCQSAGMQMETLD
ncbi:diguanylate cyclase [uncultured Methylophaga sp.]|uniref:sensor domain-containing diguanylate cyclase n=1 Tax=uncultured Methylophaga sp. TaxID=285271 RepID=UPI0026096A86|nr:diguanylate cyclase [uncultured Methylophaga sp.]